MKPIPPKAPKCNGSISSYSREDLVFPMDILERCIVQQTEKESIEKSNFDNLICNSIRTLSWAHRMHKLLWEGEPKFNDQNTARYNLVLEFEDEIQEVFDQQYEYLKNYAESLKNKDVSIKCLKKLEVIKSLYK